MTQRRRITWWVLVFALAAATVSAVALGGWQLTVKNQPLPADQAGERAAAMRAASEGAVAILGYTGTTADRKASASVMQAGVQTLTSATAEIVLFVNQSTTSKDKPEPTISGSSMLARMSKVNGKWIVNRLDPV